MSIDSDATPAYRGYRLQALYTLSRVLAQNADPLVFQPEGLEDLVVRDSNDRALEIIQVKQRTSNLALSSFKPDKPNSFFSRASAALDKDPQVNITLVAFGAIGPELERAIRSDGSDRTAVAKKLASYGFISDAKAKAVLERMTLLVADERSLTAAVYAILKASLAGVDPDASFDLLTHWLYVCAENRTKISRSDVIDRINRVGEFIAARATYNQEWFTSIVPLDDDLSSDPVVRQQLADEFYRGISARYEHILANLDVVRADKLAAIANGFSKNRVVIVHAASGQGKTTLGFRYLRDFFPAEWRFRIASLSSREQVLRMALAITKHADAIGVPVSVYVDVKPRDTEWSQLVAELSAHANIRVLVTIREEDWKRSNISGADFDFLPIDLEFDRAEAEQIYTSLTAKFAPANVLSFEEAWTKFGEAGPLMEFIYLVTQGTSLHARLKQQVANLENDVRQGHLTAAELNLLRLVSIGSAFEARLQLVSLTGYLELAAPGATLGLFEREYLLRVSDDGSLVNGLHPIRSSILADLLSDSSLSPWGRSAAECLALIYEPDLETFLLYSFSRRTAELESLLEELSTHEPKSWTAIAGCIRSQIWLGVAEYLRANDELIKTAEKIAGPSWSHLMDFALTDSAPDNVARTWWRDLDFLSEPAKQVIEALQSRQSEKNPIFARVGKWLEERELSPESPISEDDWLGIAETLFWLKQLNVSWPLQTWLPESVLNRAVEFLPLESLASVVLGLVTSEQFSDWITMNRPTCLDRFRRETLSVKLEDDGHKVTTHFVFEMNPEQTSDSPDKRSATENRFHWEARKRIELLRRFLPERDEFSSQGYGHLIWDGFLPIDESIKDVARKYLPIRWRTSVNALLGGLGNQQFRPGSWREYAELIMNLRRTSLEAIRQLERGLDVYFRRTALTQILENYVDTEHWSDATMTVNNPPLLPSSAVDEWGFVSEATSQEHAEEESKRQSLVGRNGIALRQYKPYLKAFDEHTRTLTNFFSIAKKAIVVQSLLGRRTDKKKVLDAVKESGIEANSASLGTMNLSKTLKNLSRFQSESEPLLSLFYDRASLEKLNRLERETIWRIWTTWYFFAIHPDKVIQSASSQCAREATNLLRQIRQRLRDRLRGKSSDKPKISIVSETLTWNEDPALWITVDVTQPWDTYAALGTVIAELKQAVQIGDEELRRYMLDIFWPYLVVIPLTRGKCLTPVAWRVSTAVILQQAESMQLSWWNLAQLPIPTEAVQQLKLSTWDIPQLAHGQKLLQSTVVLFFLAGHIRDFRRLGEIDDEGMALLQEYVTRLNATLSEALQTVLDAETEMASAVNSIESTELENRAALIEMAKTLPQLHELILPTVDFEKQQTLTLESLIAWADRLEQAPQLASICSLDWTADVLSEHMKTQR
jgi:hypothetical protein